nr:MAG TPA: hypothetical protein [Caudoviricetes sp.]
MFLFKGERSFPLIVILYHRRHEFVKVFEGSLIV